MEHTWIKKPNPIFKDPTDEVLYEECIVCKAERHTDANLGLIGCWRNGNWFSGRVPDCFDINLENLKTID